MNESEKRKMTLLQQLVKDIEVYDIEGVECQLTDIQVLDNCIEAIAKTKVEVANLEFEDRSIDFISAVAECKIWINIYDIDVKLNERVKIDEVESKLIGLSIKDASEEISDVDRLSERVFEFLSDFENVADVQAYVTFRSLV